MCCVRVDSIFSTLLPIDEILNDQLVDRRLIMPIPTRNLGSRRRSNAFKMDQWQLINDHHLSVRKEWEHVWMSRSFYIRRHEIMRMVVEVFYLIDHWNVGHTIWSKAHVTGDIRPCTDGQRVPLVRSDQQRLYRKQSLWNKHHLISKPAMYTVKNGCEIYIKTM